VLTELKSTSVQFFDVTLSTAAASRSEPVRRDAIRVERSPVAQGRNRSPWKDRAVGCWKRQTAAKDLPAERDLEVERGGRKRHGEPRNPLGFERDGGATRVTAWRERLRVNATPSGSAVSGGGTVSRENFEGCARREERVRIRWPCGSFGNGWCRIASRETR
jgi:hypothetical protein